MPPCLAPRRKCPRFPAIRRATSASPRPEEPTMSRSRVALAALATLAACTAVSFGAQAQPHRQLPPSNSSSPIPPAVCLTPSRASSAGDAGAAQPDHRGREPLRRERRHRGQRVDQRARRRHDSSSPTARSSRSIPSSIPSFRTIRRTSRRSPRSPPRRYSWRCIRRCRSRR